MGRAIVVVPSIFTLANLFFGMWAIVLATQGQFYRASWYIVIAGVLDMLDGLFARMSRTGSQFGAQLDSLVDLVSFGVAPAFLVYAHAFAQQGQFAWVFSYAFAVCAALRLARFNVQLSALPHARFTGLPSPAAGMTLATYYPFSTTPFYQEQLAHLPWNQLLIFLTIVLALAMVSNVGYARLPRVGWRSWRGVVGLAVNGTVLAFGIWARDIFFFPLGIAYVSYGMLRAAVAASLERGDEPPAGEGVAHQRPQIVRRIERRRDRREPPAEGVQ